MSSNENTIVITPHEGQIPVLTTEKRIVVAIAGIQGGKTFVGCLWTQLEIQKYPDKNHLVCALSHDQLQNVTITKFFDMFPGYAQYYIKKEKTIYLPTGGKVFFRPLEDPKYTEGITAHSAWIDEADLVGYRAYLIVRGRVGATGGRILLTSSLADAGWLAENVQKWQDNPDVEICHWRSKDNPNFPEWEWEALQKELDPIIFKRRYEAEFTFSNGLVYSRFKPYAYPDGHIVTDYLPGDKAVKSLLGFDWGYIDPTAIVVVQLSALKNVYIRDDFEVEGTTLSHIEAVANKFKQTYKPSGYYADPSNKMVLEEVKKRIHSDIQGGNRDIYYGTQKIRNLIFQGRFYVFKDAVNTINELKSYRFKETLMGYSEEPEDKHNHVMDAIRMVTSTYPIPEKNPLARQAAQVDLPAFWARRTKVYKKEAQKYNENNDIWMP